MKARHTAPRTAARKRQKAKTSEIVAHPEPKLQIPAKWRTHFNRLVMLRDHLVRVRNENSREAQEYSPNYSLHMADAATDNFDRDFALTMLSSEQNALYEIEQALERLRNGTYGKCELTGKPISADRLNAIPWARFSTDAEKTLEERGTISRTRLAQPTRIPKETAAEETDEENE